MPFNRTEHRLPYHAWSYNRKGELIGAPNMRDVDEFDNQDFGLNEVECRTWMGFLWIRLEKSEANFYPETTGLASIVAPWNIGNLKIHKSIEYQVKANWKLIFQNYNECYHCPTVHPALNRLTPYKDSTNDFEDGPILGGPMRLADDAFTMSMNGQPAADPIQSLDEQQRRTVGYYTIFPTMFLSVHPDFVLVHLLERVHCGETKVTCQFLFDHESTLKENFNPNPAIEFWDMTNRQDWHVCELTQQGMASGGYQQGPYSNLESVVAAFDRYYRAEMG